MISGTIPLLLLCLAAGYAVLVVANRQERPLDKLGRIIGGVILLASVLGFVGMALCKIECMKTGTHCPFERPSRTTLLGSAPDSAPSPTTSTPQE